MKRKKMEFSKKIFTGVSIGVVAVVLYAFAIMWVTKDTSGLDFLIPAVFAELATATGFYFNKAKAENLQKNRKQDESEES